MKSKKRKTPQAVTLLTRIENVLAEVLDDLSVIEKTVEKGVRSLLVSAEASVSQARDLINPAPSPAVRHKAARKHHVAKSAAKRPVKARKLSAVTAH